MEGQTTIFDYLGDFSTMTEEEMVTIISQRLGIKFKQEQAQDNIYFNHPEYEYKHKGLRLTVSFDMDCEGKTYISVGYMKGTAGGGAPRYSIDSAVEYFERVLKERG